MRWLRAEIDRLVATVMLWFRGCQHPKMEPQGAYLLGIAGEEVTFYLESCTLCGILIIHEA